MSLKARRGLSLSTKVSVSLNSVLSLPLTDENKVDGYNLATRITYGPRNNCVPMDCSIPQGKVQQICPAEVPCAALSDFSAASRSAATDNTDEHCGKGNFVWLGGAHSRANILLTPALPRWYFPLITSNTGQFPIARVQYCDAKGRSEGDSFRSQIIEMFSKIISGVWAEGRILVSHCWQTFQILCN